MNGQYTIGPRGIGYLANGTGSVVAFNEASHSISSLWTAYDNRSNHNVPIVAVLAMTQLLKRHFGDFRSWVEFNVKNNPYMTIRGLEYIADTIRFTQGDLRTFPPMAWESLISSDTAKASVYEYSKLFDNIVIPTTDDLISNWLQQPHGIEDMFVTAKILFGTV